MLASNSQIRCVGLFLGLLGHYLITWVPVTTNPYAILRQYRIAISPHVSYSRLKGAYYWWGSKLPKSYFASP